MMTITTKYSILSLKICEKLNADMLNITRISNFHFNMERFLQLSSSTSSCRDFCEARKIATSCGDKHCWNWLVLLVNNGLLGLGLGLGLFLLIYIVDWDEFYVILIYRLLSIQKLTAPVGREACLRQKSPVDGTWKG
jgi:hypothetical protein